MSMKISKDFLMRNLKIGDGTTLIKENDKLFCQFDEIKIHQKDKTTIEVIFFWKDELLNKLLIRSNLIEGNVVTLCGFTGKLEVVFEGEGETSIVEETKSFWTYQNKPDEHGWYPVKILGDAEYIPTSAYWDGAEWNRTCVLAHGKRCSNKHQAKDLANKNC